MYCTSLHLKIMIFWICSHRYRAPEVLLSAFINEKYSFPVDLWASGCVVAELIDGQAFLTGTSEIDQLDKIESALGPPPSHLYVLPKEHARIKKDITNRTMGMWDRFEQLPPEGLKFLSQLLDYDPKRRLTAAMALKVSFLDAASVPPPIKDLRTMPRYFPGCWSRFFFHMLFLWVVGGRFSYLAHQISP